MTTDLVAAMRRATELTRAFDLSEATRVIQDALAGRTRDAADARPNDRRQQPVMLPERRDDVAACRAPKGRKRWPLAEVVQTLKGATVLRAPAARHPAPSIPDGAQFLSRSFACASGSRQYKLFVPARSANGPRALIVMLHGCQQNPDDFATGTKMNEVAAKHNLVVAYPSQPSSANAGGCWNWFAPAHQVRGRGEPAVIAGMTRELMDEYGLGRTEVFVAGLSAGGAMAAVMLETYPDVFSGAGIHSGLAYRAANDVMSAFAAMRGDAGHLGAVVLDRRAHTARTIIFHGEADRTVHPDNARRILASHVSSDWTLARSEGAANGQSFSRETYSSGDNLVEVWSIAGAGHAWSGGDPRGTYASRSGPDASAEMVRFFLGA